MAFKLFVLAAIVTVANAGFLGVAPTVYHAPVAAVRAAVLRADSEVDPNPSYSFNYDVQDASTGDSKGQTESLENGVVKGSYSIDGPDGIKRTVEYTADDVNGFNAVVNSEPSKVVVKTPVVKTVASIPVAARTVVAAAPAVYHASPAVYHAAPAVYHAAPLAYHAPITKVVSTPVARITFGDHKIVF